VTAFAILALLNQAPVHFTDRDEPPSAREARLKRIAYAIHAATKDPREQKALVVIAVAESTLARYVQEGRCMDGPRGSRCDPKDGRPRARTVWQLWRQTCPAAWAAKPGSEEELGSGAVCTVRLVRSGWARCQTIEGMFAAMYGRPQCVSPRSAERAAMFRRM
jgi:hypothetical protein